jgi:hypothetical protein
MSEDVFAEPSTLEFVRKMVSEDEIDEALEETFPASDPPPWTLGDPHAEPKPENDDAGRPDDNDDQ